MSNTESSGALDEAGRQIGALLVQASLEALKYGIDKVIENVKAGQWGDACVKLFEVNLLIEKLSTTMATLVPEDQVEGVVTAVTSRVAQEMGAGPEYGEAMADAVLAQRVPQAEHDPGCPAAEGASDTPAADRINDPEVIEAVQDALKQKYGVDVEVLSVGADGTLEGRMEGQTDGQ